MFVEFPSEHVFSGIKNIFFELMSEGIRPIIVHPERNSVFRQNPGLLYELVCMGGFVQANSGSFIRLYGTDVKEAAFRFLELNLIHFIASDSHSPRRVSMWLFKAVCRLAEIIGEEKALLLVTDNPEAVINDREIPYLPDPIDPEAKKKKITIKIPRKFSTKK
jgi:protein-tyrosine phosphatase